MSLWLALLKLFTPRTTLRLVSGVFWIKIMASSPLYSRNHSHETFWLSRDCTLRSASLSGMRSTSTTLFLLQSLLTRHQAYIYIPSTYFVHCSITCCRNRHLFKRISVLPLWTFYSNIWCYQSKQKRAAKVAISNANQEHEGNRF